MRNRVERAQTAWARRWISRALHPVPGSERGGASPALALRGICLRLLSPTPSYAELGGESSDCGGRIQGRRGSAGCEDQNTHHQKITLEDFQADPHGKTFADILNDPNTPFDKVLEFFNDPARQQRMEDSEIHHDRAPLAGVVRELESLAAVGRFMGSLQRRRSARLRQAIGVLVRMIMERRGWRRTGKKGSLGVRGSPDSRTPYHNIGGLALWFIRAERYRREGGMPFRSVRERVKEIEAAASADSAVVQASRDQPSAPSATGKG